MVAMSSDRGGSSPFEPGEFSDEIDPERTVPLAGGMRDDGSSQVQLPADDLPAAEVDTGSADVRLYLKYSDGWTAHIKRDWMKEYCYSQNPGEDFYHVLVGGEVYLQRGTEKFCLTCALRHGYVTRDRMHWQRGGVHPQE